MKSIAFSIGFSAVILSVNGEPDASAKEEDFSVVLAALEPLVAMMWNEVDKGGADGAVAGDGMVTLEEIVQ